MSIEITYNSAGGHEATATAGKYFCTCIGLSKCGEAFFSDNFDSKIPEDDREWLRDEAFRRVKQEWDYDGNNWSAPVDKPEDELAGEADDEHPVAIVRTAFHGGGVRGFAVSDASAEAWISFFLSGSDCKCGCFGSCPASELSELPEASETRDPYTIAK